uniref:SSD domain-containing protein n=1 Tax=Caenorhabditis japonica TaxID=281687 RepID=A0A8R1HQS5_CAEJA
IIFLAPVLAYAAEMEENDQHALIFRKAIDPDQTDNKWKLWLLSGSVNRQSGDIRSRQSKKVSPVEEEEMKKSKLGEMVAKLEHTLNKHDEDPGHNTEETLVSKIFREIIGPFILQRSTQVCALLLYLVYITLAIGGCLNIKEGLDPKLLVRESFYLSKFYAIIDETFWREGLQMQVVVNNPPNLFHPETRKIFDEMMSEFEGTQYTMKPNATMLWLRAYETHLETELQELNIQKPNTSSEWYQRCRDWLVVAGGRRLWQMDMVWANKTFDETPNITAFRFQLGLRNYRTPTDHTHSCKLMRSIAEKYSDLNVTTFHEYYPFADQYLELTPSLFQNIFLDLGTILAVSLIMIPDIKCAISIVLSIASINVGVLGFMSFWGVNLDSVSIITVIMCIGFAVDLSAHIAYAFSQSFGNSHARAVAALETLGWPVFLGASSTVLGILLLTLVDSYIVQIFFKTVFIVINLSILHGLVFLPIFMMLIVTGTRSREQVQNSEKSKNNLEMSIAA